MLTTVAVLIMSMLSAGMSGSQVVVKQEDDYRLRSAAESAGNLAVENLWSAYLRENGGAAGNIATFRAFLANENIAPGANNAFGASVDLLKRVPVAQAQGMDQTRIDALALVRRDRGYSTELFFTVTASARRGEGSAKGGTRRTMQLVYSIQPASFEGFDYAILTRNVNCIFCHTKIDTTERAFNTDPAQYNSFARAKVGTLESMEIRNDGKNGITDQDADTLLAGTLYVRGSAYTGSANGATGVPITDWSLQSMLSSTFDKSGQLQADLLGNLVPEFFTPAGSPPGPMENLYLNYPLASSDMVDGVLPEDFPPPFADDGGLDPATGLETPAGAGNKIVDPNEFYAATLKAEGTLSGGVIQVLSAGQSITTDAGFTAASTVGNTASLAPVTHGNVILTGTAANPIVIDGTVAIDGDVVIQGVIKGKGVILAKGNMYMPASVTYADGKKYLPGDSPGTPTGPRTFGVAQDGTLNMIAYASGGNLMIGDYLGAGTLGGGGGNSGKGKGGNTAIVDGTPSSTFNFALSELANFNRTEWTYTQPLLPDKGQDPTKPATWTVVNPTYKGADYIPRFYQFGPGDSIPIYNKGKGLYYDAANATWRGPETPFSWDLNMISLYDPADKTVSFLYDAKTGAPKATVLQLTASNSWLADQTYENATSNWEAAQTQGTPFKVDGLMYTNNAIFGIIHRNSKFDGAMNINGSMICADLGLLAPGVSSSKTKGTSANLPGSDYKIGLTLNYDARLTDLLDIPNPFEVHLRRMLWVPMGND
ncbi:MAG: hypothetical protein IPJ19_00575 [Planctomycetes bacterium]|nr:hypothetical protein [Planctomycetota bacterium]